MVTSSAQDAPAPALAEHPALQGIDAQPDLRTYLAAESAKYRRMVEVAGITP